MAIVEPPFYRLKRLAELWKCDVDDLLVLGSTCKLRLGLDIFCFIESFDHTKFSGRYKVPGRPQQRGLPISTGEYRGNPMFNSFIPMDGIVPIDPIIISELTALSVSKPIQTLDIDRLNQEGYLETQFVLTLTALSEETKQSDYPTININHLVVTKDEKERYEQNGNNNLGVDIQNLTAPERHKSNVLSVLQKLKLQREFFDLMEIPRGIKSKVIKELSNKNHVSLEYSGEDSVKKAWAELSSSGKIAHKDKNSYSKKGQN